MDKNDKLVDTTHKIFASEFLLSLSSASTTGNTSSPRDTTISLAGHAVSTIGAFEIVIQVREISSTLADDDDNELSYELFSLPSPIYQHVTQHKATMKSSSNNVYG